MCVYILNMCVYTYTHIGRNSLLLKLHVSFGKEPYKRDHILQKRPIILRSLLIVFDNCPSINLYVCVYVYIYICCVYTYT